MVYYKSWYYFRLTCSHPYPLSLYVRANLCSGNTPSGASPALWVRKQIANSGGVPGLSSLWLY